MNSCAVGSLTYKYAYYLKNGRDEADSLFCKLSWLVAAKPIIDGYIPVGTLISEPEVRACGLTNTVVGFAPAPSIIIQNYQLDSFIYNGIPLVVVVPDYGTLEALMDAVIVALTSESGVQWSYTQISQFEFQLCAPYTQNGDTVDITIEAFYETSLGFITMAVILAGGVAPETPERFQTDADNCITETQYNAMLEAANWTTRSVKCCDITKPTPIVCTTGEEEDENDELREDSSKELREDGN